MLLHAEILFKKFDPQETKLKVCKAIGIRMFTMQLFIGVNIANN